MPVSTSGSAPFSASLSTVRIRPTPSTCASVSTAGPTFVPATRQVIGWPICFAAVMAFSVIGSSFSSFASAITRVLFRRTAPYRGEQIIWLGPRELVI